MDADRERYALTWAGKHAAGCLAETPPRVQLAAAGGGPPPDLTSGHAFIEGDNLDALKLLQTTHRRRVKLIYIDPPYNTGNAALPYADNFARARAPGRTVLEGAGSDPAAGAIGSSGPDRAHAAWLSFLYPRLILARRLLREDGLIAVSIDDHEVHRLRLLLDEVFGEDSFIAQITVVSNPRGRQAERLVATVHEYLLLYAKRIDRCAVGGLALTADQLREFKHRDAAGRRYRLLGLRQRGSASRRADRPRLFFPLFIDPASGRVSVDPGPAFPIAVVPRKSTGAEGRWMWSAETVQANRNRVEARLIARRGEWDIFVRDYLDRPTGDQRRRKPRTVWDDRAFNYQNGTRELKEILGADVYQYPKPVALIRRVIEVAGDPEAIVLDFFAGSATTAQAVLELNQADGGDRRFLCVQSPEPTGHPDFPTIADLARERIRRVAARLSRDVPETDRCQRSAAENSVMFLRLDQ
ncbi:MAG TPA: site-specific DNA-methyltransferase [Dehalococcoidia bacterium]|nr:site-specific DNA-methyltransferase [Dehalococcoidia bacterium]